MKKPIALIHFIKARFLRKAILLSIVLLMSYCLSFGQDDKQFYKDLLIKSQDFVIQNSNTEVSFFFNEAFIITDNSSNTEIRGKFEIETFTFEKGKTKLNPDDEITFTILNYIIASGNKEVWVHKPGLAKVEDGYMYLTFFRLNDGFDSPEIVLMHRIVSSFDWSDVFAGSRFLSTVDFVYRGWLSFIVEEAMEKPNQEEALRYALDALLDFPDEERQQYADLIRTIILEKYKQKN